MGKTSWQAIDKYKKKVYTRVVASLPKELVAQWETRLRQDGTSKAEFIRSAIQRYLDGTAPVD